jgi:pyruvate,water dikinase
MKTLKEIDLIIDKENIGNKSYNLSLLKKKNINIPNGFVLKENDIKNIKDDDVEKMLVKSNISDSSVFAVRSSALGEDGNQNSFAGIFKSKINIKKENILSSIEEINQSFYSRKSIVYQQIKKTTIKPQILIQEMIKSKYSMVLFIKDNNVEFSLIDGSCEKIVSGEYNSLEFEFNINNIEEFVDNLEKEKLYLDIKIRSFFSMLNKIQEIDNFKENIDIETTFDGNEWYILQIRKLF